MHSNIFQKHEFKTSYWACSLIVSVYSHILCIQKKTPNFADSCLFHNRDLAFSVKVYTPSAPQGVWAITSDLVANNFTPMTNPLHYSERSHKFNKLQHSHNQIPPSDILKHICIQFSMYICFWHMCILYALYSSSFPNFKAETLSNYPYIFYC